MKILKDKSTKVPAKTCRSLLLIRRKKFKNIRQCHGKRGNTKQGMWNLTETIKYIAYIKSNIALFETEEIRRQNRVFCIMAKEIKSRNSVQCRSHHQKMCHTYGSTSQIIEHYEANVIPYYSARMKLLDPKSSETNTIEPLYEFKEIGTVLRIQIKINSIASY